MEEEEATIVEQTSAEAVHKEDAKELGAAKDIQAAENFNIN